MTEENKTTTDGTTDLDTLLDEYKQPQTKPESTELNEVVGFVREFKQEREQEQTNKALNDTVAFFKEDETAAKYPDAILRGYMHGQASDDPAINAAFRQRITNPSGWETAQKTMLNGFLESVKEIKGDQTTDDLAAAKASVRGISETPQSENETPHRNSQAEAIAINAMSDVELRAYKEKVWAERNSG